MLSHVVSVKQLCDKKLLADLFDKAAAYENLSSDENFKPLNNKVVASLFFEPSTRTRFSFETAVYKLGGNVITVENGYIASSAVKGETIEDTIRTVSAYADCIIMRHPAEGVAEIAAQFSLVPFINAGEGAGEHPTQALLDLYTIHKIKKNVNGKKIALVGDLLYGRTIHSLAYLLGIYKVEIFLVSPPELRLPQQYKDYLKIMKINYVEMESWDGVLEQADIIYMTRVQKERFKSLEKYERHKDSFILDNSNLKKLKTDAAILHPLPRVNEISSAIDNDPRALYFEQVKNGLFMRMALLDYIIGNNEHKND